MQKSVKTEDGRSNAFIWRGFRRRKERSKKFLSTMKDIRYDDQKESCGSILDKEDRNK